MSFNTLRKTLDGYMRRNCPMKTYNTADILIKNTKLRKDNKQTPTAIFKHVTLQPKDTPSFLKEQTPPQEDTKESATGSSVPLKKVLSCPIKDCDKQYTSSFGLKYHLKEGHIESKLMAHRPYSCSKPGCKKKYRNTNGLKYHMRVVHKEFK